MSAPTALYRLFAASGDLLYVGISSEPERRWKQHAEDKSWWPEVHEKTVEWHQDRLAAEGAESTAIRSERPSRNIRKPGKPNRLLHTLRLIEKGKVSEEEAPGLISVAIAEALCSGWLAEHVAIVANMTVDEVHTAAS